MKHQHRTLPTFDHGLGKTSPTYIHDLFVECFTNKKPFGIQHLFRNARALYNTATTWRGYIRILWSLYLKKHSWDFVLPDGLSTIYTRFCTLYNQHHPDKALTHEHYTIPPIVHQIWLGSPFPQKYRAWQQTWQNIPGWEYKLWTEADVPKLNLRNKDLYEKSRNWGERADIIRYEILHRYGGLYVDTDFVCLQPAMFEQFHRQYDFYGSLQPLDIMMFCLANGVIGAAPQHPIIEAAIDHLASTAQNSELPIWARTGPVPFTRVVYHYAAASTHKNIVFPPYYFFPRTLLDEREYQQWPLEAVAVHHWAASWNTIDAKIR